MGYCFACYFLSACFLTQAQAQAQVSGKNNIAAIKNVIYKDYRGMFHLPSAILPFPFITPGSAYSNDLWDWDSWLTNIALEQIVTGQGSMADRDTIASYSKGCIRNFLHFTKDEGYMLLVILHKFDPLKDLPDIYNTNMHKPVLAQHAAFIVKNENGDAAWLKSDFGKMEAFIQFYRQHFMGNCSIQ